MSFVVYEHLEGLQLSQGFLIAWAIQWGSTSLNPSGAARGIVLGARAAGSKEAAFELLDVEVRLRTNDVTWWGPWVVEGCWWLSPKKKCCEGMHSLKLTVRLPLLRIEVCPKKNVMPLYSYSHGIGTFNSMGVIWILMEETSQPGESPMKSNSCSKRSLNRWDR